MHAPRNFSSLGLSLMELLLSVLVRGLRPSPLCLRVARNGFRLHTSHPFDPCEVMAREAIRDIRYRWHPAHHAARAAQVGAPDGLSENIAESLSRKTRDSSLEAQLCPSTRTGKSSAPQMTCLGDSGDPMCVRCRSTRRCGRQKPPGVKRMPFRWHLLAVVVKRPQERLVFSEMRVSGSWAKAGSDRKIAGFRGRIVSVGIKHIGGSSSESGRGWFFSLTDLATKSAPSSTNDNTSMSLDRKKHTTDEQLLLSQDPRCKVSVVLVRPWAAASCRMCSTPRSNLPIPCVCFCLPRRFRRRMAPAPNAVQETFATRTPLAGSDRKSTYPADHTIFTPACVPRFSLDLLLLSARGRLLVPPLWDLRLTSLSGVPEMLHRSRVVPSGVVARGALLGTRCIPR